MIGYDLMFFALQLCDLKAETVGIPFPLCWTRWSFRSSRLVVLPKNALTFNFGVMESRTVDRFVSLATSPGTIVMTFFFTGLLPDHPFMTTGQYLFPDPEFKLFEGTYSGWGLDCDLGEEESERSNLWCTFYAFSGGNRGFEKKYRGSIRGPVRVM